MLCWSEDKLQIIKFLRLPPHELVYVLSDATRTKPTGRALAHEPIETHGAELFIQIYDTLIVQVIVMIVTYDHGVHARYTIYHYWHWSVAFGSCTLTR